MFFGLQGCGVDIDEVLEWRKLVSRYGSVKIAESVKKVYRVCASYDMR